VRDARFSTRKTGVPASANATELRSFMSDDRRVRDCADILGQPENARNP
jgi:hypothetical protein